MTDERQTVYAGNSTSDSAQELQIEGEIREKFFVAFDCTRRIGNIDFCVDLRDASSADRQSVVWAERKRGRDSLDDALVQLILTIGKARTFESELPPPFLAAFNAEQIAFIPYERVMDVFSINDFNWNVAPSDHTTREFADLRTRVADILATEKRTYGFRRDVRELKRFIANLARHPGAKIQITKTNFTHIYYKWREDVLPTLTVADWKFARKQGIIDADFYLADILSTGNRTDSIFDKLRVLLENDHYVQIRGSDKLGEMKQDVGFKDAQKAHRQFWNKYRRPPRREYWNYIIERRDLLVPQDVRETKGAFFTPAKWVALSQDYLARELGENWQERYVVWDCCAGTGNMEVGLVNPRNVWASTLDAADVAVMKQRIGNGANLFENHVFQFDFLNDPFDNLPEELRAIVTDPEKRKKLVIYINPPYAEGDNRVGRGRKVSEENYVTRQHGTKMGYGKRELFVQFLTRIHAEIGGCVIGEFSTLKVLQAPKFKDVRENFRAMLARLFIVPANTFDNVKGDFPIGFKIWRTDRARASEVWPDADVYERDGLLVGTQRISVDDDSSLINDWVATFLDKAAEQDGKTSIGTLLAVANDFQHQNTVNIAPAYKPWNHQFQWQVSAANAIESCVYFAARLSIAATWLNDRDQFLYPNAGWTLDRVFQGDCLVYTLLHGQNRISSEQGVNHWIPFTESEVGSRKGFRSHFMSDLLAGKTTEGGGAAGTVLPKQGELAYGDDAAQAARLAYYRAQELGRTWYDAIAPEDILALKPIVIDSVDPTANRRTVKEIFRKMAPVRNAADGRVVRFTVRAAKKLVFHKEINLFGMCFAFDRLFAGSRRAWSETTADIPNHRYHSNIDAYHHYVAKATVNDETYYVRFTVREDVSVVHGNEFHGTMVTRVSAYKAESAEQSLRDHKHGESAAPLKATGTGLSLRSHTHGEGPVPFVDNKISLFLSAVNGGRKIILSAAARMVLDAGRELWKYYHAQPGAKPNASYYDIRKHFQGMKTTAKGKEQMNPTSSDLRYNMLLVALRDAMKNLAGQIAPKVYDYGFLKV